MDVATGSDGPDVVIHRCTDPRGCGSEFVAWEFILHGEQICCVLVRKLPYSNQEAHNWADWLIDVQNVLARSGDLLRKYQSMDYGLHLVEGVEYRLLHLKWVPRVRSRLGKVIDYTGLPPPTFVRGVKRPLKTPSPQGVPRYQLLSPGALGLQRHVRFAAGQVVFPFGKRALSFKSEVVESLLVPDVHSNLDPASLVDDGEVDDDGGENAEFPGPDDILLPGELMVIPPLPALVENQSAEMEAASMDYQAAVLELDASDGAPETPFNTLADLSVAMPEFPEPVPTLAPRGQKDKERFSLLNESDGASSDEDMFASFLSGGTSSETKAPLTSTHDAQQVNNLLDQAAAKLPSYLLSVERQMSAMVTEKFQSWIIFYLFRDCR